MIPAKFCKKCQVETDRNSRGDCKLCAKKTFAAWALKNKEKIRESSAFRYASNANKLRAATTAYRLANPEKVKASVAAWRAANKEHIKESKAAYREANPEVEKLSQAAYRAENRDKVRLATATWRMNNAKHISEYAKRKWPEIRERKIRRLRHRYRNDPLYAMCVNVRNRTTDAFRKNGFRKNSKTFELLGCDWDALKIHIERQFVRGMNWGNKSRWHVDHIIPIASAKSIEDLSALCHYTNLRPMWALENIKKGAKNVFLI